MSDCALDYGDTIVTVHDLLYERHAEGWRFSASSYTKLRLDPVWAQAALTRLGMDVVLTPGRSGMVRLTARRVG